MKTLLFIISLQIFLFAQDEFTIYYPDSIFSIIYDIEETTSGDIFLAGISNLYAADSLSLVKADNNGKILFQKKFPTTKATFYYRINLIIENDELFLLSSYKKENKNIMVLQKFDKMGAEIWSHHYEKDNDLYSWMLEPLNDGGWLIGAFYQSRTILIKTDFLGNIEWEKEIGVRGLNQFQCIQINDNNLMMVKKNSLFKLDLNGDSLWVKELSYPSHIILQDAADGFYAVGKYNIIHTNEFGEETGYKQIGTNTHYAEIANNNKFMLAGSRLIIYETDTEKEIDFDIQAVFYSGTFLKNDVILAAGTKGLLIKRDLKKSINILTQFTQNYNYGGRNLNLQWHSTNIDLLQLEYSIDAGKNWLSIKDKVSTSENSFTWKIPDISSDSCMIRIYDYYHPEIADTSQLFTVVSNQNPQEATYNNIAINNVTMWLENNLRSASYPGLGYSGMFWNNSEGNILLSKQEGFLIGGNINGENRLSGSYIFSGMQPGVILENKKADNPDKSIYKIWKTRKNIETILEDSLKNEFVNNYNNWPIETGAPWLDQNNDNVFTRGIDKPALFGDEDLYFVSNDLDTLQTYYSFSSLPMGLEVQTSVWAYNDPFLNDVVFKKITIINKGSSNISDMILSYYAASAIGSVENDGIGCDSSLQMGYSYNLSSTDSYFSNLQISDPPAVGHILLQGPVIRSSENDFAFIWNKKKKGYKNLTLSSFSPMIKSSILFTEPSLYDQKELQNLQKGQRSNGTPFNNPKTHKETKFPFNGDVYDDIGWNDSANNGFGERSYLLNSGGFTLMPGDTQVVVYAIVIAQGSDHLNSIEDLKKKAVFAKDFFEQKMFPQQDLISIIENFSLKQNYPNPFNNETILEYELPKTKKIILNIYDVLGRKVKTLVNKTQQAGKHSVTFDASGLASGVYYYKLRTNAFEQTRKMLLIR